MTTAIVTTLNSRSWEVHTEIELDSDVPPLQASLASSLNTAERDEAIREQLRAFQASNNRSKRALLLKVSHVGGHKYAGNMVLYAPSGAGIWYGRVTPKEVSASIPLSFV